MRRTPAVIIIGALVVGAVLSASSAVAGGGGCTGPPTAARGDSVDIEEACIDTTVLHARPGDTITWTNRDGFRHIIQGANLTWSSGDYLEAGERFRHRFGKPGIYPYSCYLHPGMNGAVVVGAVESPDRAVAAAPSGRNATGSTPGESPAPYAWARGIGVVVLLVAGGAGALYALMRTTRGRGQPQP